MVQSKQFSTFLNIGQYIICKTKIEKLNISLN